ncbi:MAG: fumarylacetoacetase [Verrucomicrobia bacterium]|nr:fumarylacetoacetase [Verrucomicrobiota bacterium]
MLLEPFATKKMTDGPMPSANSRAMSATVLLNATHDPLRMSWVESANVPTSDFPLQNLPYGVFETSNSSARIGVAIGDQVLDLAAAADAGLLPDSVVNACRQPVLNDLMALGQPEWSRLRVRLSELLDAKTSPSVSRRESVQRCLVSMRAAQMRLPARVGDYTDFYASSFHATNVGALFRPENPLLPNYKWVPIGYHGRASSLVVSGTPIRRPKGQLKSEEAAAPTFEPCRNLDYEVELGAFVGPGNPLGASIPIEGASAQIFGVSLLNDWSARDIQSWEYQPLGPFLSKNFATSLSPWVVTLEALAPFRAPAFARPAGDPAPLPYLNAADDQACGGLGITLEASLLTPKLRAAGQSPQLLSRANFADMYWTLAQLFTHHASNGCNLSPGDLLGSGTVSGPEKNSRGCLLEATRRGADPITLPDGETRTFLLDGDEVIFRGYAERDGTRRIGFGECRGVVLPASP